MRLIKNTFIVLGFLSIFLFSFVVFAADDDLLNFIPAIVKAQTIIDPVGTYIGSGIVTMGGCACNISNTTVTVDNGPIAGSYKVSYSHISTTDCTAQYGSCSWSDTGTDYPSVINNKQLVFGNSYRGSYQSGGQTYYQQTTTNGFIDFTNAAPVFVKTSAHQVTGPPDNAYSAIVRLNLQKNP